VKEALELYESLCARANPLGLLLEQIDPSSGAFLGNYPQAFSLFKDKLFLLVGITRPRIVLSSDYSPQDPAFSALIDAGGRIQTEESVLQGQFHMSNGRIV